MHTVMTEDVSTGTLEAVYLQEPVPADVITLSHRGQDRLARDQRQIHVDMVRLSWQFLRLVGLWAFPSRKTALPLLYTATITSLCEIAPCRPCKPPPVRWRVVAAWVQQQRPDPELNAGPAVARLSGVWGAEGVHERGPLAGGEVQDGASAAFLGIAYADETMGGAAHFHAVRVRDAVTRLAPAAVLLLHVTGLPVRSAGRPCPSEERGSPGRAVSPAGDGRVDVHSLPPHPESCEPGNNAVKLA